VSAFIARRDFIVAAGAAACSAPVVEEAPWHGAQPPVAILKQRGYTQDVYATVRQALLMHRLDVKGKKIVLKPNIVEFDPNRPINTHPMMVHAALVALTEMGAAEVRIAEGPGHRRTTLDMAEAAGYFETIPDFEDRFTDLNLDDVAKVNIARPRSTLTSLYLPKTILGCDLLVSIPKLKTHHWVAATLSMKNLFGIVPGGVYGWPKKVLHWAGIEESIADIASLIPHSFALVDGVVGMEGNGPIQGSAKHAGVIISGPDLPTVDATCCRIMGIDPLGMSYLRMSRSRQGLVEPAIRQVGELPHSVRSDFALLPQFSSLRLTPHSAT
jgi:uncharacterized protein (DUF362 family)